MGLINTHVDLTLPFNPIQYVDFTSPSKAGTTFKDMFETFAPQFDNNAELKLKKTLFNGHLQTIYTSYTQSSSKVLSSNVTEAYYKRLVLNYPDGGEGTLDISVPEKEFDKESVKTVEELKTTFKDSFPKNIINQIKNIPVNISYFNNKELKNFLQPSKKDLEKLSKKPLVIILHGLTGGSNEGYVTSMVKEFQKHNIYPAVLNSRGCAFSTITTPTLYNGFWTDDIRFTVQYLKNIYPDRKFYLVGFSLGASVLTNYLGQEGDKSQIEMGIAVSVPWDMIITEQFLNSTYLGKCYSQVMARNCKEMLQNNIDILKRTKNPALNYDNAVLEKTEFLKDFDNNYTAKMFGFNSAGEYYRHASCINRLFAIRTPYIGINSFDDPILGPYIPTHEAQLNPYVTLVNTEKGGHVAYVNSQGERWFSKPIVDLIKGFHEKIALNEKVKLFVPKDSLPQQNKFVKDRIVM